MSAALFDDPMSSARFSSCSRYRYTLHRQWSDRPGVVFIMLNPSTADATSDDSTIRRCLGFAKGWGAGSLTVLNLYAFRATDPRDLWLRTDDPVGPDNDRTLSAALSTAEAAGLPVIAAWGAQPYPRRVAELLAMPGSDRLECLGFNRDGSPRHPLYLPATSERRPWPDLEGVS